MCGSFVNLLYNQRIRIQNTTVELYNNLLRGMFQSVGVKLEKEEKPYESSIWVLYHNIFELVRGPIDISVLI